jgi:hypothetical protein
MRTSTDRPDELKLKHRRFLRRRLPWYIPLLGIACWLISLAVVVYFLFLAWRKQLLSLP